MERQGGVATPDSEPLNILVYDSLRKIGKGSSVVFLGMILGMLFGLLSRILIARWSSPELYGVFSLGLGLTIIFGGIATLGLSQGTARYIAYYRGKNDLAKIRTVIFSSIQISLMSAFVCALVLYFGSNFFADKLLHGVQLSTYLKIFSIAIVFMVLIDVFIAISRGFNKVEVKAYFQNVLRNLFFLIMAGVFLKLRLRFNSVIWAYTISLMLTFTAMVFFIVRKQIIPRAANGIESMHSVSTHFIRRQLLLYSIPVLATSIMGNIFARTDTLMLGYFKTTTIVGYYNAAYPIANLIPIVMSAIGFTLFPILSELYAKGSMDEMRRIYVIITKWVMVGSFPLFTFFFVFPETILDFLFGAQYNPASAPLQIMVLAVFLLTMMGPTDVALQAAGETKFITWTTLIGLVSNIVLNFFLIPGFGMIGAAIAYLFGRSIIHLIQLAKLKQHYELSPFDAKYFRIVFIFTVTLLIFYMISRILTVTVPLLLLIASLFVPLYGLIIYKATGLCKEDLVLLRRIKSRITLSLQDLIG